MITDQQMKEEAHDQFYCWLLSFYFYSFDTQVSDCEDKRICKYSNTELFLVRIQENTDQKKLRIWALFTQCVFWTVSIKSTLLFKGVISISHAVV